MARPAILGSILINILKKHHLLNANELLNLVQSENGKQYNKTSIYRALEKLEQQGTICQHIFFTDETKYELRHDHHDHLVCSQCGNIRVASCTLDIPTTIDDFQVQHHHLTIFGLCANCQKSEK